MKTTRLIFGIFFVIGVGVFAGGIYSIQQTRRFLRTAVETRGVVTEIVWRESLSHSRAEITRVELNTSLVVNGANPYRIECQWLDPARNEMHIFHSANIWFDPTNYIPGKTIEVLVDPDNPRRYAVETAFLPKVV